MQVSIRDQWDLLAHKGIFGLMQLKDFKDMLPITKAKPNSSCPHMPGCHKWSTSKQDKAYLLYVTQHNSSRVNPNPEIPKWVLCNLSCKLLALKTKANEKTDLKSWT